MWPTIFTTTSVYFLTLYFFSYSLDNGVDSFNASFFANENVAELHSSNVL